jgi:hypothetical protein
MNDSDVAVADKVLAGLSLAPLIEEAAGSEDHIQATASPFTPSSEEASACKPPHFPNLEAVHGDSNISLGAGVGFDDFSINWDDSPSSLDWLWAGPFAPEFEASLSSSDTFNTSNFSQPSEVVLEQNSHSVNTLDTHEDDSDSEFASQIAARFGSLHIASDGALRFFGTTANAHLFASGQSDRQYVKLRTMTQDGARLLNDASLDAHVDTALEQDLVEYFFAWHNSCHYVVDRSVLDNARRQYAAGENCRGLFSPVLVNAM